MNRLILIGNGFDLAHGLKTDYNSFILWYLDSSFRTAYNSGRYDDDLISIRNTGYLDMLPIASVRTVSGFVDHFYKNGFWKLKDSNISFGSMRVDYPNPLVLTYNSALIERITGNCNPTNWVDIENDFYDQLKQCYFENGTPNTPEILKLNNSLSSIINQLHTYLSTIKCEKYSPCYSDILNSAFNLDDILKSNLKTHDGPVDSLILNFNYTSTVEGYFKKNDHLPIISRIRVNYIHGRINDIDNKLIFGFGDELDEDYKKMELSRANEFFEYIKSFWYFKTSNYHDLVRFIESDEYQIYILGHSCGLSDRTMLNMLFEHDNCKSIKIYYHGDKLKNNYTKLTQEISRHFKNKVALRGKIVSENKCSPMPQ